MATTIATDSNTEDSTGDWRSAWPDALAFVVWLAVAWYSRWTATDLVWSLWLSSLVVGYAMILWPVLRTGSVIMYALARVRQEGITIGERPPINPPAIVVMLVVALGGLFVLAFLTVHFGGFHYVHSQFLISFFPLDGGDGMRQSANMGTYLEVFRRYWTFLPAAFIAERASFLPKPVEAAPDVSVTAQAIALRKMANARKHVAGLGAYKNVVRMHILIFFFAFAHFAKLENFAVYAVVYTVYFFPWRLVRRSGTRTSPAVVSA